MLAVRLLFVLAVSAVATGVLATPHVGADESAPKSSAPVAPPAPSRSGDVGTMGLYLLESVSKVDPTTTTGWIVDWKVPTLQNFDQAWGAIGQWYYDFESGIYKTNGRWGVYYYSDENGPDNGDPDCREQTWPDGRICGGELGNLQPGQRVRFFYQLCQNNTAVCLWVDIYDGEGLRYLANAERARNDQGGWDMYAHDIETFEDSGLPAPIVSCADPTVMVGQLYQKTDGSWVRMTGDSWEFQDHDPDYRFQNINTGAVPATWQSCSG